MNNKRIYIRADASRQIGFGHLIRCLALAHMLKNDFVISFFVKEIPQTIFKEIELAGFAVIPIEEEEEFLDSLTDEVVVVLDHNDLHVNYQKKVKAIGCKLVCIDDLQQKEFYADLVINHAPGVSSTDYKGQSYTSYALGIEYVLLRPAFLKAAREDLDSSTPDSLLVCFGGADPQNFTFKTLEILLSKTDITNIIVVTGSAYVERNLIDSMALKSNRINHLNSLNELEMTEVLKRTDLAIVPPSGILLEALATGCKIICLVQMQKNINVLESCKRIPSIYPIEHLEELEKALVVNFKSTHSNFIDGRSDVRILEKFQNMLSE